MHDHSTSKRSIDHHLRLDWPSRFTHPDREPPPDLAIFAKLFLKDTTPPTSAQINHLADAHSEGDPLADEHV